MTQEQVIKVCIVDDHQLLIEGIKALLQREERITITGEAGNGADALKLLENIAVDIVLVDINMAGMGGIELLKEIAKTFPNIRCIILTMHNERSILQLAIQAGAKGYLLKTSSRQMVVEAITSVYNGETYFDAATTKLLKNERKKGYNPDTPDLLTAREIEILQLIAKEKINREIADELFISEHTVRTHRKNIFHKVKVKNIAGLIQYAHENNFIS